MASPPYASAASPPYPSQPPLPKKRPSEGGPQPSIKRRKASTLSVASATSAHPLRQTSFPPEARSPLARSPSVDATSHVSGSQVSAPSGPQKKKRGRKPKNHAANADGRAGTPSVASGRAGTIVSGAGTAGDGQHGEDGADDDDDNDPQMDLVGGDARTQEQKQEEIRMRAMLVEALDPDQMDRYELWRAGKLTESVVKRVVNATVSQSVPPTVTLAMKSVAKYFLGDIIEKAVEVQYEWMHTTGEKQSDEPFPPQETDKDVKGDVNRLSEKDKRGPLRPDHLREAWRRYKAAAEGGFVGTQGLWHEQQNDGVERFPVRTGGRRIFR
ncbi:hypothetical protein ACRALDRAFT_1077041 [Sodiomyces alcalophilus JCM 7366]|uniref:uncharacterized protein n=1 Tax=Sodiomyces alcalophilus JCM 7366 TaxID=591952 RepID=UPI0039B66107